MADAIARHDFHAAEVKKLVDLSHGKFYRARLGDADRLLFSLVRHGDDVCAVRRSTRAGSPTAALERIMLP